ncbi:GIY-YIG nuclease superfamily protein [Pedobacter glucosidilyticus]|uniref:GIY-YIG nuclease family protein n=1 Tax=Pedobacter aquae TaxID=2605747 RepID=A0A5C0VII8_9SPHI|nr:MULTISPECIES: GIY-YIG nuclease family protein [Pedobacter]KHJ37024.1 GIY-YIG nuclease superfamily protein [Pedobacter glucosidilyticus]QEK52326.1 GIY-YIG nuclease family protein [Pedobacter aquae]
MEDKFFVYALISAKDKRIYVGFSGDLDKRIHEHNSGKTKSTKGFRPWTLLYFEEVQGRDSARKKEKYYKSGIGKEFLKSLLT